MIVIRLLSYLILPIVIVLSNRRRPDSVGITRNMTNHTVIKDNSPNIDLVPRSNQTGKQRNGGNRGRTITRFGSLIGKNYSCAELDIIPQANIDIIKFMGLWKAIAHTLPPNEYLFDSGITEHLHRVNNSFQVKHAGFFGNQCIGPSVLETWLDTNNLGWVHSDYYNEKKVLYSSTTYRIMYTDRDYTILYACRKTLPNGKCAPSYPYVIINGRPGMTVEKDTWCDLLRFVRDKFCIYLKSIHLQTQTNDCKHKLLLDKGFLLPANFTKTEHPTIPKRNKFLKVVRKRSLTRIQEIHRQCLKEIDLNG